MKFFLLRASVFCPSSVGSRCSNGINGNLVFEPSEITIAAGESVHFVNNMLPPHNVIVEDHPELGHEFPGNDVW